MQLYLSVPFYFECHLALPKLSQLFTGSARSISELDPLSSSRRVPGGSPDTSQSLKNLLVKWIDERLRMEGRIRCGCILIFFVAISICSLTFNPSKRTREYSFSSYKALPEMLFI